MDRTQTVFGHLVDNIAVLLEEFNRINDREFNRKCDELVSKADQIAKVYGEAHKVWAAEGEGSHDHMSPEVWRRFQAVECRDLLERMFDGYVVAMDRCQHAREVAGRAENLIGSMEDITQWLDVAGINGLG
jgi:hypothetical protein